MTKKRLFVILVVYKNKQYIDGCIGSLLEQGVLEERIIVVDNASPNGEVDYIRENWRDIRVIRLGANMGFSKANNEGMKLALSLGADYCLLLNLDTVICDGMLEELISSIPSGDNGISTARIYATKSRCYNRFDSEETISWYTGGNINRETFIINQQLYDYEDTTVRDVEFASGCCMLIPKEIIQRAGFLDESYFLYYEDVDYCLRLRKLGITIRYNPKALLWHAEGGSQRQGKKVADYYWTRNRLLCIQKHMELFQSDPLELIKTIIRNEDYFRGYNSKKIVSYEKKAIEDFIDDKTGQIADYVYYFDDSFEKETKENNRGAAWATDVSGSVLLCNLSDNEKYFLLEFGIDTEDTKDTSTYTLYLDGELYSKKCPSHMGYKIVLPFNRQAQHRVTVVKDRKSYAVRESDGTHLFFRLNNFGLQEYNFILETGALKIDNIGITEWSQQFRWNWIQAEDANIVLVNPFHLKKKYRISFSTFSPSDQRRVCFSIDGECFEEEVGKEFKYELYVGAQERIDISFYGLNRSIDAKFLSLIDFKWELIDSFSSGIGSKLIHTSPYVRGFGEQEQGGDQYWNWIVRPQAKVVIHNTDYFEKVVKVSFCTFSACDHKYYTLSVNGNQRNCTVGEEIILEYGVPVDGEVVLLFYNLDSPKVLENGTELYLSVINFKIEYLKAVQWQIGDCGRVVLYNQHYESQRYRIRFDTFELNKCLDFKLPDRGEVFVIERGQFFTYEVMLGKKESLETNFTAEDCSDMEELLKRINFLVLKVDSFEAGADYQLSQMSNYIQGFSVQERDQNSYWNWIIKSDAKIILHNTNDTDKYIQISYDSFSACDHKNYTLSVNGKKQECTVGEKMTLQYRMPAYGELALAFSNMSIPKVLDDGTELYLSVINFKVEELKVVRCQIRDCGRIVLSNQSYDPQRYRICFDTMGMDAPLDFKLTGRGEVFDVGPGHAFIYEVMLDSNESMEAAFAAQACSDMGELLERINFLITEIDSFTASADCQLAKISNYTQGFGQQEQDENSYWNWIIKPDAKIIFHNTDNVDKNLQISFSTFSACDNKEYTLVINGNEQKEVVGEKFTGCYILSVGGELNLCFKGLEEPFEPGDGRKLYLSIINFKATMSEV